MILKRCSVAILTDFRTLPPDMSTHTHHHNIDYKKAFSVEKLAKSEVKISGELPYEEIEAERKGALKKLGANVKIDGFRPGHVPDSVLVKHIGEMAILVEAAERAIQHHYAHIVEAHELDVIGYPKIDITKIASANPLGFTATVAILPAITLPDYKVFAKDANRNKVSVVVTDTDVEEQINDILRRKVAYDRLQAKAAKKAELDTPVDLPTPKTTEEASDNVIENEEDLKKLPLPELSDELIKTLGQPGQFTDVADFKAKIREHLEIEKKRDNEAKHRATITDTIISGATMDLPQVLIEGELNQMFAQMEEDIERAHLKMDDYLQHIGKTRDNLKTEWTPIAEKRAKLQLILNEIAKKENITPDTKQLNDQVVQLLSQYKNADEKRVRIYVASVMTNEAVMKFLESQ